MSASKWIAFVLIQRWRWREQATSLWPGPIKALSLLLWTGEIESVWHDQNLSTPIPHTQSSGLVRGIRWDKWFRFEPGVQKEGGGGCSGRAVTFPMMSAFPITDLTRDPGRWFNGGILFLLTSPLFFPPLHSPLLLKQKTQAVGLQSVGRVAKQLKSITLWLLQCLLSLPVHCSVYVCRWSSGLSAPLCAFARWLA